MVLNWELSLIILNHLGSRQALAPEIMRFDEVLLQVVKVQSPSPQ